MTEISLRLEPPFARIVLCRPDRRNAISLALCGGPSRRSAPRSRRARTCSWHWSRARAGTSSAGGDIAEFGHGFPRRCRDERLLADAVQDALKALIDSRPPDHRRDSRRRRRRWTRHRRRLRSPVLRCRRVSCDHAREAWFDLRPCRDAPAGRAHRRVARQRPAVHGWRDRDRRGPRDRTHRSTDRDRIRGDRARLCARTRGP